MVSLKLTKRALAWRAAFLRAATEYLLAAGARPNPHANDFVLETRAGPLSVSVYGNWLACRFADPALANALLAPPGSVGRGTQRLNPWSGKWNFHFSETTPVPQCLAEFAAELGPLLSEGPAAAPAGVQDGLIERCGRDAPEPLEEPPMKAHAEPLARLLLDRDYNALVRGNERRGDTVRAMAADDYAQEFLDEWGWAAYSVALELLGKQSSGGGSTRVDGRDVSLFAGGINAEPFRLEYGRVDAAPRHSACRDLGHAAAVVALMLDNALRKSAARRARSDASRRATEGFVNPFKVGDELRSRRGLHTAAVLTVRRKSCEVLVRLNNFEGETRTLRCTRIERTAGGGWACDLGEFFLASRPVPLINATPGLAKA